jgi:hypothetical protein
MTNSLSNWIQTNGGQLVRQAVPAGKNSGASPPSGARQFYQSIFLEERLEGLLSTAKEPVEQSEGLPIAEERVERFAAAS